MPRIFISLGSNINPEESIGQALRLLKQMVEVIDISTFYCTEPVGPPEQPPFYNGVVEAQTDLPPMELKENVLRKIERDMGRKRDGNKYAPRVIDLDTLVYDVLVMETNSIILPDPHIADWPFLAVPLYELEPEMKLPGSGVPLVELVEGFRDHKMKPLPAYTERLRKDLKDGS